MLALVHGQRIRKCVSLLLTTAAFVTVAAACTTAGRPNMNAPAEKAAVLFMCPYGGAKSVIAASYFNRLAEAERLPYVASAAAAETPYEAVPKPVADVLEHDGFDVASFKPRPVAAIDFESAAKVVSIDCDLSKLDSHGATVEEWNDVPKVSVDLPGSVAAIRKHGETLIAQLRTKTN
jgi:arsenate reductase (thioredoxin)